MALSREAIMPDAGLADSAGTNSSVQARPRSSAMTETDSSSTLADGLFWLKTMYGIIMMVVAFGCGLLPWRVRRGGQSLLSQATAFSGGVFLGAAFLHLLSEAADAQFWKARTGGFPTPYLLCIIGFLLVMAFEELVAAQCLRAIGVGQPSSATADAADALLLNSPVSGTGAGTGTGTGLELELGSSAYVEHSGKCSSKCHHNQGGDVREITHKAPSQMGTVLVVALSFHAIFDGLAVGTTTSSTAAHAVATAVLLHKPIAAFALGSLLIRVGGASSVGDLARPMAFFALTSPVGLILGMLLLGRSDADEVEMTSAVSQSVAAGTFIYVATIEVIAKEFSHTGGHSPRTKMWKFTLLCAGVALSAMLKAYEPDGL